MITVRFVKMSNKTNNHIQNYSKLYVIVTFYTRNCTRESQKGDCSKYTHFILTFDKVTCQLYYMLANISVDTRKVNIIIVIYDILLVISIS